MTVTDRPEGASARDEESRPTARELLVLQLLARGYSPSQIDRLLDLGGDGDTVLERAAARLHAATPQGAAAEARRRGMIV